MLLDTSQSWFLFVNNTNMMVMLICDMGTTLNTIPEVMNLWSTVYATLLTHHLIICLSLPSTYIILIQSSQNQCLSLCKVSWLSSGDISYPSKYIMPPNLVNIPQPSRYMNGLRFKVSFRKVVTTRWPQTKKDNSEMCSTSLPFVNQVHINGLRYLLGKW
jgi:hypothetical protein